MGISREPLYVNHKPKTMRRKIRILFFTQLLLAAPGGEGHNNVIRFIREGRFLVPVGWSFNFDTQECRG
jgi:hypothetical protein